MVRGWGTVAVAAGLAFVAGVFASPVAGVTAGTLNMNASLSLVSLLGGCQPAGGATDCAARTLSGPFPGLGSVTSSYAFQMDLGSGSCPTGLGKALSYPIRVVVAGKGAIDLTAAEGTCEDVEFVKTQTQAFTVTGGTGIYAGASGNGTLTRTLGEIRADGTRHGLETWQGTLSVPGLAFDVTAPTIAGATSRKVVAPRGATRVRVRFVVTATDDVDGSVPVTCKPRSGTRFHIGRTPVQCSATDSSANTTTATFRITVRRHRHRHR